MLVQHMTIMQNQVSNHTIYFLGVLPLVLPFYTIFNFEKLILILRKLIR